MTSLAPTAVRVVVATTRPAVRAFFENLGVRVAAVAVAPEEVRDEQHFDEAAVAVVDAALDPAAALALCAELRIWRPTLPVLALVCCPHALAPWHLRELLAAGVSGILDLRVREDEVLRAVDDVIRGETVLHLQLGRGGHALLSDAFSGRIRGTRTELIELVARGLSDREIAQQLHLSPHTVKHHIEQLRTLLGVRNRTELASWAGRNGFYSPARAARS